VRGPRPRPRLVRAPGGRPRPTNPRRSRGRGGAVRPSARSRVRQASGCTLPGRRARGFTRPPRGGAGLHRWLASMGLRRGCSLCRTAAGRSIATSCARAAAGGRHGGPRGGGALTVARFGRLTGASLGGRPGCGPRIGARRGEKQRPLRVRRMRPAAGAGAALAPAPVRRPRARALAGRDPPPMWPPPPPLGPGACRRAPARAQRCERSPPKLLSGGRGGGAGATRGAAAVPAALPPHVRAPRPPRRSAPAAQRRDAGCTLVPLSFLLCPGSAALAPRRLEKNRWRRSGGPINPDRGAERASAPRQAPCHRLLAPQRGRAARRAHAGGPGGARARAPRRARTNG
jgi:hypothetical protein